MVDQHRDDTMPSSFNDSWSSTAESSTSDSVAAPESSSSLGAGSEYSSGSVEEILERVRRARQHARETREFVTEARESVRELRKQARETMLEARMMRHRIQIQSRKRKAYIDAE